jgi:hypothetical protein
MWPAFTHDLKDLADKVLRSYTLMLHVPHLFDSICPYKYCFRDDVR